MAYDLFHLPQPPYTQVYNSRGTYTWNKPQGITMVSFFVVGAGGGGGGGNTTTITTGSQGGGGGGGGGVTKLLIPAVFIPETLILNIGAGGAGGAATVAGTLGGTTYIDIPEGTNVFSTRIIIANGGSGGGAGGGTAGAAGAGAAVVGTTSAVYHNLGMFTAIAGGSGSAANGTFLTGNTSVSALATLTSGGSGGGVRSASPSFSRGSPGFIDANGTILSDNIYSDGNVIFDGPGGYNSWQPFQSIGGVGGWARPNASGPGGNGGNGGIGSGGGGGGGNNSGFSGGRGGNGGDGLVIITSF